MYVDTCFRGRAAKKNMLYNQRKVFIFIFIFLYIIFIILFYFIFWLYMLRIYPQLLIKKSLYSSVTLWWSLAASPHCAALHSPEKNDSSLTVQVPSGHHPARHQPPATAPTSAHLSSFNPQHSRAHPLPSSSRHTARMSSINYVVYFLSQKKKIPGQNQAHGNHLCKNKKRSGNLYPATRYRLA